MTGGSRELKPTSGLKERRGKMLPRESCSHRSSSGRSCGLCNKENGVTKTQRQLGPQKLGYLPTAPVAAQTGRKLGRIIPHHFFPLLPSDFLSCLLVPRLNEKPDSKED